MDCWEGGARRVDCYGVGGEEERGGESPGGGFEEGW